MNLNLEWVKLDSDINSENVDLYLDLKSKKIDLDLNSEKIRTKPRFQLRKIISKLGKKLI